MSSKKTALLWFKTNLRLRDNECLTRAMAENDQVIPFYCFDDRLLAATQYGARKIGAFRLKFLKESLQQLDEELRAAGSGLFFIIGPPEKQIIELAKIHGAQTIYAEKEVAPEELALQAKVEAGLFSVNCKLKVFECRNLFYSGDLPFPLGQLPEVFTEFRKKTENIVSVRAVIPKPKAIPSPTIGALDLSVLAWNTEADERAVIVFKGGSVAAHERLRHYFYKTQGLSVYKETRNGMLGEDYSSKFSAWLSVGCISPREIYEEVKNYEKVFGANDSTYWLIFELLWRDYFGFYLQKDKLRFFRQASQLKSTVGLNAWKEGRTGEPFIDANMTELRLTGFMSNRGRQNVASYLCNNLKVDWRYGAAYFEQQLIDYDVCSNWGNWAYLAGVGNDPRANRYFNTAKQAAIYDPQGRYVQLWTR
ncbi:DASH family cryptochrome [Mucilaginibacter sp. 44-25]|uniref:DASH family cryptochrome n=1 Tax=Mucilaginibacter sp. 44-25 TaxID=1895794 RepID=UPI00095B3A7B|nr:DASH family cryptochrome [Mucilaginibacter sp. 44-25]OJW13212.1 MAG: cryptochrome DASH [Mucilaginibacter sp. 44-25]HEK19840.1 DASH family cryptochrome [Bacteroidota bacterium]